MSKKSDLERVRDAICEVFGEYLWYGEDDAFDKEYNPQPVKKSRIREIVERDTFTGADDPGGWSPGAVAIIHCENGIPNGAYETHVLDKWFEVSELLGDLYCEHINAAVIGVYPS